MSLSYNYKVNTVRVTTQEDLTDVVKEIEVNVTGVDGEATFSLPVVVKLSAANANSFTSFEDLTEEQIVSWIESDPSLDGTKAHIAFVVAKEVEKLSLELKPLPWAEANSAPVSE